MQISTQIRVPVNHVPEVSVSSLFISVTMQARAIAVSTFQLCSPTCAVTQSWGTISETHVRAVRSGLGLRSSLIWQFFKADANCGAFIIISTDFLQRLNALFSYLSPHLCKKKLTCMCSKISVNNIIVVVVVVVALVSIKFTPKNGTVRPGINILWTIIHFWTHTNTHWQKKTR